MIYDIPHDNKTQDLIFKTVGGCSLELTFLPPLLEIYEAAPIYFIITGGGWFEESRAAMLGFSADSVQELRNKGFAVVSPDYRTYAQAGVKMEDIISDCFDASGIYHIFLMCLRWTQRSFLYQDILPVDILL